MTPHFVKLTPQEHVLGNAQDEKAARLKRKSDLVNCANVIFNVFDHIERTNDIELFSEWDLAGIHLVECGTVGHAFVDKLETLGLRFRCKNLQAADPKPGTWVGPVSSTYGKHYVWVEEIEPERDANLEEVQLQLSRDIESRAKTQSLRKSVDKLRERYEIRT